MTDSRYEPLAKSVQTLQKYNKKIKEFLGAVGGRKDTGEFRSEVQNSLNVTRNLINNIQSRFNDLGGAAENFKFKKLRRSFESEQKKFSESEDSIHAKMEKFAVKPSSARSESTPLLNADGNDSTYGRQQQNMTQLEVRDYDVDVYQQNQQAIRHIENEIMEVHDMFKDFHDIVAEQQDDIDDMEENVVHARDNIEEGARQVDKAAGYQRAKRKKMCYILCVLLVVAVVIVVIVFSDRKK